jgi:ectoine hydroxylase
MRLSQQQLDEFDRAGFLFFPSLFTKDEIRVLTDEVPSLYAQRRPENVREKTGDVVRTNFAAHMYSYPFAKLARHPRMVEPVRQVFGEDVYMHQFKINGKAAFDGDVWQWHQDYGTWRADDEMPEARAMNVAIFLDDVNEFNGPLMFIPAATPSACSTPSTTSPRRAIRSGSSTTRRSRSSSTVAASSRPRAPRDP